VGIDFTHSGKQFNLTVFASRAISIRSGQTVNLADWAAWITWMFCCQMIDCHDISYTLVSSGYNFALRYP
jgi:hypothetical protein